MNVGSSGKITGIGQAMHSWTFDGLGDYKDGIGTADTKLATGYARNFIGRCGGALGLGPAGALMPLGTAASSQGVGVVMDLLVPAMGGAFTLVSANPNMNYGWQIVGKDTSGSWSLSLVVTNNATIGTAASKTLTPADGNWHHVEVFGQGFVVTFVVDGGMAEYVSITPQTMVPPGPLSLVLTGSATPNVAIDNLWIYPGT
jgi:hypothetical protein